MKTRTHPNQTGRRALVLTALLAGVFMAPAVRAQPAAPKVDNRLLLIFEISSDMKPRLPAVQKALDALLANSMNGQLHSGDSIGVWTFDQDLHRGQFQLRHWAPENAPMIASDITKFVSKQHYSKKTSYGVLPPVLSQVVQDSERLTVLIFCDGKGEIHGTPYDPGINKVFQERQEERQQKQLPIVVGLRSQRGQYVDCTVNFPPQPVSLLEFPPLPEVAPAPPVEDVPAPPSPLQSSVPSLIIVGTNIASQVAPPQPKPATTELPPATNLPPMTVTSTPPPAVANVAKPPDGVPLVQTSAVPAQSDITVAALIPAKAAKPPPEIPGIDRKGALAFGVVFGVAFLAGGLVVFILRHDR
jgi:hypothetical protein